MANTSHLVITVHGIRTNGDWQDELKTLLEAAEPGVTVRSFRYGFFSSLAFLIPPLRWLMGRQFRSFFVQEVRSVPEGARIDLVAHSFGTYLAASALKCLPAGKTIHTVIFAGSVLPVSFPWYKYLQAGTVGRVVNECGWDDWVLVLCQSTALLMGMAGRIGFHGMIGDRFVNRYYRWGHGGYFNSQRPFMRDDWVPLLTGTGPVPRHDERPPLTALGGIRLFLLSNMHFIKVVGACAPLMLAVCVPIYLLQMADYERRAERLSHIGLLTNAQEIPDHDPSHVRDLLKIDARATDPSSERAIDHLMRTQTDDDSVDDDERENAPEPLKWWQLWERFTGISEHERMAYTARYYHHLGNRQLVASNKASGSESQKKAKAHYETALTNYEKVNDDDPAHGSYALCLIDYATLLFNMGQSEQAVIQYKKVRGDVFRPDRNGQAQKPPPSLMVDSLIFESRAHKLRAYWTEADKCLEQAVKEAGDDNTLLSAVHDEWAYLHMDRLEVDKALVDFENAWEACRVFKRGQVVDKIRRFHIRHGRALADRLKGMSPAAYEQYENIVKELKELLANDTTYTPKQRRDLRARLYNSMERRVDVALFARYKPTGVRSDAHHPDGQASRADFAAKLDEPSKAQSDFDEAIKLVPNDDLPTRTRLLYKKVVARFIEELEQPWPSAGVAHRIGGTIDEDFARANRTFDFLQSDQQYDLELYHQIAGACMALHTAPLTGKGEFDPLAVQKLRELTTKSAKGCAQLIRDKVEMLLVALEILLDPRIEPDSKKVEPDGLRMMAVLGETTKVGSHPELASYFERFQKIAARREVSTDKIAGAGPQPAEKERVVFKVPLAPVSSEKLLFYLWLGPRLQLRLTREQLNPEPRNEIPAIHELAPLDVPALTRGP